VRRSERARSTAIPAPRTVPAVRGGRTVAATVPLVGLQSAGTVEVVGKTAPTRSGGRSWVGSGLAVTAYVCAIGPTLVIAAITLYRGWSPTADDAVFSWRAWNVISRNPTLLGAPTHGYSASGHAVFAPGPVLSWFMAVPVHANPKYGAFVVSVGLAAIAEGVIVAAARSRSGPTGGLVAAAGVVALCWAEPQLLFNPVWTPWIGLLWFSAGIAAAWPLMSGRLAWAPVVIVAVSVAAQAHIIFAPAAVLVGALAMVMGVINARRRRGGRERTGRWWLASAGVLGVLLWTPTVIAEFSSTPGNLQLIVTSRGNGSSLGASYAMHGAATAVAVLPSWGRTLPQAGGSVFYETIGQLYGASILWWIVGLVLVGSAIAWGVRRGNRALLDLAVVTLVTNVVVVVTVAQIPGSDALEMTYLSVIFFPAGILTWCCVGWLCWDVVKEVSNIGGSPSPVVRYAADGVRVLGAVALLAFSVHVVDSAAARIPSQESLFGGPSAEGMAASVVNYVREHVRTDTPVRVEVDSPQPLIGNAVQMGAAYQLHAEGWDVRFIGGLGEEIGTDAMAHGPTAVIRCDTTSRTCTRLPPGERDANS